MAECWTLRKLYWNNAQGHDKIWGWVHIPGTDQYFCFWGRRCVTDKVDKSKRPGLSFKYYDFSEGALQRLAQQKLQKGYHEVSASAVDTVVPNFSEVFEQTLILARLSGNVKADAWSN
jgi:hypothetical protein